MAELEESVLAMSEGRMGSGENKDEEWLSKILEGADKGLSYEDEANLESLLF